MSFQGIHLDVTVPNLFQDTTTGAYGLFICINTSQINFQWSLMVNNYA